MNKRGDILDKDIIGIIAPDGTFYVDEVDDRGHAIKLIKYYDINNLPYDKNKALFIPSQTFATNLSNMGYIVFMVENHLTALFIKDNTEITDEQINTLIEKEDIMQKVLNNKIICFNIDVHKLLNSSTNKFQDLIQNLGSRVTKINK